jgi:CRP-like cAMP-binding protein
MKTIARRLHRLEERLGLLPETEFDRRLRARIEAAHRRLAEARERGDLGPPEAGPLVEACRRRLMEAFGIHVKREPASA